ncbi:uncharacterized protein LOC125940449 [Dermacentor silvarum]|uniref:uncharacterized protein LOC125940449 n=1 Tax=Dermacentor silvarum TaxID=543639 RepID=UPI002101A954|nr:uncharacterized protein LOC125940449 [Dermacentor silvarum]
MAASGANMQGQATTSHNSAHDSCLASKQQQSCSQATTVDFAAVLCGVVVEVAGCKSRKSMPDRESCLSSNLDRAICTSERAQSSVAKRCNRHRAVLSSKCSSNSNDQAVSIQKCGITADSSVQAVLSAGVGNHSTALMPGCSVASFDATASVKTCASNSADVLLGAGANKIFLNSTFDNFVSFKESFDAWCKEGKHVVAVSKSNKNPFSADSKDYEFLRITYRCIHGGPARQRGIGKRPNQSYNSTNCEMSLSLVLCKEPALHYKISQLKVKHNHSLDLYNIYPQKRLLSSTEKVELYDLVKCNVAPKDFKNLAKQKTGKTLTTKDVYNYKMEYSIPIRTQEAHGEMLIHEIESLIEKNPDWVIHYEKNNENNLQFILIQTSHMREMFEKYPEVIFVDGTYKVNRENYVLYSILVEDGRGRGRCVCYAFVRNETTEIVRPMFEKFVDFNPFVVAACKVVMIERHERATHLKFSPPI